MSHTTRISGIEITNVAALKLAVEDLIKDGVPCSLLENSTPRAYSENQAGMGLADYVIKLNASPYDVGLYKDGNKFEPRTDFFMGHVAKELGVKNPKTDQERLGRLYQFYSVNATEQSLRVKGISSRRLVKDSGVIQLRALIAA